MSGGGACRYDLYGVVIEAVADDPSVLGFLDDRLAAFRAGSTSGPPMAAFRFNTGAGPASRPGDGRGRPVYDLPDGHAVYRDGDDVLSVGHEGVSMVADLRRAAVETWAADDDRARWLATHPFFTLALLEVLKRHRLFSLHAAACRFDTGGVLLLAGPSGAGKSTLALALAQAGLGFLGDDTVFLTCAGLEVRGFPDEVDVTDHTAALLPALGHLLGRPKPPGAAKHRLAAGELAGAGVVAGGRAVALVFPQVCDTDRSSVSRVGADEALLQLVPNVLLTDAASSQDHVDALGRLARECPSYRLETGRDLARAADLLLHLRAH